MVHNQPSLTTFFEAHALTFQYSDLQRYVQAADPACREKDSSGFENCKEKNAALVNLSVGESNPAFVRDRRVY